MSRDGLRGKTVPVQSNPSLGELVHDGTFGALSNGPPVQEGVVPVTGIGRYRHGLRLYSRHHDAHLPFFFVRAKPFFRLRGLQPRMTTGTAKAGEIRMLPHDPDQVHALAVDSI